MKKIYLILSSISLALFFNSCGGGSGDMTDRVDLTGTNIINVVDCNTNQVTDILRGDTLVRDTNTTIVTLVENVNNTKNVCVNNGSAHIVR